MPIVRTLARLAVLATALIIATVAGWLLFVRFPADLTDLLGVLFALAVAGAGLRLGANLGNSLFPSYNVAEVAVEGPITRDGGSTPVSRTPGGASAEDVVDQIDRADADGNVEALIVKLNTPGGEIVPSEDIRLAAERFDGPTVGYATDTCASGGYMIAAGCDELWARKGSIVGSIGVLGSRVNLSDLADRIGVDYEQFTAGRFKDAGTPLKEIDEDERAYLQAIVDDYYEQFVADVVEGRGVTEETVRDTEARIYLGTEAADLGLVDALGTRKEVEAHIGDRIGREPVVEEFSPETGLADRIRGGASRAAYAFGAGVAAALTGEDGFRLK